MRWQDKGYLLSLNKYNENSAIADFFTENYSELLERSEVNAVIVATDENHHFGPIMSALDRQASLFIEKPLATDLNESREVLNKIRSSNVDAVLGYTQRFRRVWIRFQENELWSRLQKIQRVLRLRQI